MTFKTAASNPEIKYFDEYFYDNILLMAPSSSLKDNLSMSDILDFLDKGHNVFVFVDESSGITYRKLANQFGVDFEMNGFELRDHENINSKQFSKEGRMKCLSSLLPNSSTLFRKPRK